MVSEQFSTGNYLMEAFKQRVANRCRQLCGTVHTMGGAQAEFKKAMFALATKCQGMAESTNANYAVI